MARKSQVEWQQILLAALPADGSEISYDDLSEKLTSAGHGEAMDYFRHAKAQKQLTATVAFDANGQGRQHTVRKVV